MTELTPEISKEFLRLCADFFKKYDLKPVQVEVLIQQLEFEWHNVILIKRLLKNPEELKALLEVTDEKTT